jgi:hypothetical protein
MELAIAVIGITIGVLGLVSALIAGIYADGKTHGAHEKEREQVLIAITDLKETGERRHGQINGAITQTMSALTEHMKTEDIATQSRNKAATAERAKLHSRIDELVKVTNSVAVDVGKLQGAAGKG